MTATTSKTRKAKARALQDKIAADIRATFLPLGSADIFPALMSQTGMDIRLSSRARGLFPYAIEARNRETLDIWGSLKQCEANATKEKLTPILVFKRARSETYAVMRWSDLLSLLRRRP